jgi:uncharacterized membrane protein
LSNRGLKIALGVSLVANVFIVGAVAGALYMAAKPKAEPPLQNPVRPCAGLAAAPAATLRTALCAQAAANRPLQQDSLAAKRQALELMTAPVFDRDATNAVFARARDDDFKVRARTETAIVDFTATLPLDRRAKLVDGLRENARRRAMLRQEARAGQ